MAIENKVPLSRVDAIEIGRLYLFEYDPKYKATLPYYDRYPLVFPLEKQFTGFLGLNMHYLPLRSRMALFNAMRSVKLSDNEMNKDTHLEVSYEAVKEFAGMFIGYEECLKQYLYNHIRSSFGFIEPADWELALNAPLERWASRGQAKQKRP